MTQRRKPQHGKTALLIIDMINTLDFPEGRALLKTAKPAAQKIAKLKERFREKKLPVIYVNDNFGKWNSDWKAVYEECSKEGSLGCELAKLIKPDEEDFFILKPKHSGFYLTPLELLLEELKIDRLVITGVAGNICVLFTAHDAHMRGFEVVVPSDCIASNSAADNRFAITQLSNGLGLKTTVSTALGIDSSKFGSKRA